MRNMVRSFVVYAAAVGLLVGPAPGKPMDARAAEAIIKYAELLKRPQKGRHLSAEQIDELLTMAHRGADQRAVAAYFLAFATDEPSHEVLRGLKGESGLVSGCAAFALRWRALRNADDGPAPEAIMQAIAEEPHVYSRRLLVNRLVVDHEKVAVPLLARLLEQETDSVARCDLLYYVVAHGHLDSHRRAAQLPWDRTVQLPENEAFFFGSITPGRPKDAQGNSTGELLGRLGKLLDE